MTRLAALLAGPVLVAAFLALWRADGAALWLAPIAAASLTGGYAMALPLRRAVLAAALTDGSPLRPILSGRIGAALSAGLTTGATLLAAAYFARTASRPEALLGLAGLAGVACGLIVVDRLLSGHVRWAFRPGLASPLVVVPAGVAFGLLHMWLGYVALPFPDWLDAGSLAGTLRAGIADLPALPPGLTQILVLMRLGDALAWWLLAQPGGGTMLPIVLFLVKGAAVFLSLSKLGVDAAAGLLCLLPHGRRS